MIKNENTGAFSTGPTADLMKQEVFDLPPLEDISSLGLASSQNPGGALGMEDVHASEHCLLPHSGSQEIIGSQGQELMRPPSFPSLWALGMKDDPFSKHILDMDCREDNGCFAPHQSDRGNPILENPYLYGFEQPCVSQDELDASNSSHNSSGMQVPPSTPVQQIKPHRMENSLGHTPPGRFESVGSADMVLGPASEPLGASYTMYQPVKDLGFQFTGMPQTFDDVVVKKEQDLDADVDDMDGSFRPRPLQRMSSVDSGARKPGRGRAGGRGGAKAIAQYEIDPNLPPEEAKRIRRMLSNRESARRSRHRKQAHLQELETQVSLLGEEKDRLEDQVHQMSERWHSTMGENGCLRRKVRKLKDKVGLLMTALRGEGPVPCLSDSEEEEDAFNSAGSSTLLELKSTDKADFGRVNAHGGDVLDLDADLDEQCTGIRTRRQRARARAGARAAALERSSKRPCIG